MDLNGFKKIYIYLSLFKSSSYTCMIFCLYSVIFRVVMGPQVILLRTRVSADGLASPTKMKTFWAIKYLNIYSTIK